MMLSGSITAPAGSGVGVGLGLRIGGGGGSPSCGAMRRPGSAGAAGVGLGCEICRGVGDTLGAGSIVRGRESGCCARLAPEIRSEETPTIENSTTAVRRVPAMPVNVLNLITNQASINKRLMSNGFRGRERFGTC